VKRILLICAACLLALGCTVTGFLESSRPPTATVAPTEPAQPPPEAAASSLTIDQVKNMDVTLQADERHPTVRLVFGVYRTSGDPASPGFINANIVPNEIAFGDLNHDGKIDAAALLAENYGGTGVFTSVIAILNVGGKPVQAGAYLIDDRPMPGMLLIQDGKIIFSGTLHGPNDPGCCPTFPVEQTFGLTKGGLQLLHMTSTTPTGEQREITIESPQTGDQVAAGTVQVKGKYTISPFENTFACKVVDATGKEWFAGPLTVAGEMGQPGTIDNPVELSTVPPGILVRLELMDISAADGSIVAMDSVELMIK
jgi:hypothetical protein